MHSGQYVTVVPSVTVIMVSMDELGQSSYVTVVYETEEEVVGAGEDSLYVVGFICAYVPTVATAAAAIELRIFIVKPVCVIAKC